MCRETYFCNVEYGSDLAYSPGLFRRQKIRVDGYCSAKDNAEIPRALFVV